ncbi:Mu transposase domain-containing protein, partial [Segatella salivae]|uniref:Mu transposase domain-containing protein n=1 Tax=Segatella salivae TaxID=228604 RepID=UPI0028D8807A
AHGESYFPNGLELVVAKIWKLTVQRNGHVRLLGHYYSVPHTYVGKKESMRKRKTKESGKPLAM